MMRIELEQNAYEEINKKLKELGKTSSSVLKKAVNEAAKKAEKEIPNEIKENYTTKRSALKGATKIKKATVKSLSATITVKSNAISAKKGYETKKNTKKIAARLKVLQENSLKKLELEGRKAFLATMKNGHTGVFQRIPGSAVKGKEKIKEFYGPSIPSLVGGRKIYKKLKKKTKNNLREQVEKFMSEALKE